MSVEFYGNSILIFFTLCNRPSGNLLASLQLKKSQKNDVVFFEPNGLQHGEFSFRAPPTELQVREVLWSHDSSVLCAWCVQGDTGKETVQLWTSGNYHWYLKQNIHLMERQEGKTEEGEGHVGRFTSLVGLQWDPVMTLKLHMLTSGVCLCVCMCVVCACVVCVYV